jgi:tRNA threonylcarbamoyladenosine biosynthesis protein TsaE
MGPVSGEELPREVAVRVTRSARATFTLGERIGAALEPGDVVALVGELGAGKTQLVRGICRGAGVPDEVVASPSFAIIAAYRGRIPVHHADLYRLCDEDELTATGFFDLLGAEGAVLVEWADRIPGALPLERLEITLEHVPDATSARRLRAVGTGARHAELARLLGSRSGSRSRSGVRGRSPRG